VPLLVQVSKHLPQLAFEPGVASEDLVRKVLSIVPVGDGKKVVYSGLKLLERLALEAEGDKSDLIRLRREVLGVIP